MKAVTALFLYQQIEQIKLRLDALEANSRVAASSDQPVVGPPSQSKDSPALARPLTLPEVIALMKKDLESDYKVLALDDSDEGWSLATRHWLQHLTELDQGPVAKKPATREWRDPKINFPDSQQTEA